MTDGAGEPVLELEGVGRRFGRRWVVEEVSFTVGRGEVCALLGPNGAGKTTTLRMILGLLAPHRGEIRIHGIPVRTRRAQALAEVGAIVEEARFYPYLTGMENVRQALRMRGLPADPDTVRARMAQAGLDGAAAERRVSGYSLGMRQRLALALALVQDPSILILDEPMNGLDPAGMRDFREHLRRLAAGGMTVLLSSHLLAEVEQVAHRLVFLERGRVTAVEAAGGGTQQLRLRVEPAAAAAEWLEARGRPVTADGDALRVAWEAEAVPDLVRELIGQGWAVYEVTPVRASLESRYLARTGGRREEDGDVVGALRQ
ncbi:MAG: ABC transporter ATP-binding protein [Firmicutes bacterium]|nr:ABC transporter ATP-binding protein [Bacillota bacterium]